MAFDTQKFMKTKYTPRVVDVQVPDLKDFFGPDEPPVFKVRNLTGNEFARVHEAVDRHKNLSAIMESILSTQQSTDKIEAFRKLFGVSDDVPSDIAKRLEMLTIGSVDPVIDLDAAVKLAETFPVEFYSLTTKILEITGQGSIPVGKQTPSGTIQQSEQPSTSATPGGDLCMK